MHIIRKDKASQLLSLEKRTFRLSELATLWGITNKHTLLSTVQRYLKRGILYHLSHGVYSSAPPDRLDRFEIGCAIAGPLSYISGETVLSIAGAVMQQPQKITLFGRKTKEFTFGSYHYWCRYLNSTYLTNRVGISTIDHAAWATPARALADMRHINPLLFLDNPQIIRPVKAEDPYAHPSSL